MSDSAVLMGQYDVTPEIFYEDGLARLVVKYYMIYSEAIKRVQAEFRLTPEGKYTFWQQGIPDAYPNGPREIVAEYLADMTEYNPGTLPVIDVLGNTEAANRKLLEELGITARHLGIEDYIRP